MIVLFYKDYEKNNRISDSRDSTRKISLNARSTRPKTTALTRPFRDARARPMKPVIKFARVLTRDSLHMKLVLTTLIR